MLSPRNKAVSVATIGAYLAAIWHGAAAVLWTPESLVPFLGDLSLLWAVGAVFGGIGAIVGYCSRRKIVEAVALMAVTYSFAFYAVGIFAAELVDSTAVTRQSQLSAVVAATLAFGARSITLYVATYRENKRAEALQNAVKDYIDNER